MDRAIFYTLREAQVLTAQYRQTYNGIRPHISLGYRPPTSATVLRALSGQQPDDLALCLLSADRDFIRWLSRISR